MQQEVSKKRSYKDFFSEYINIIMILWNLQEYKVQEFFKFVQRTTY